MSELLEAAPPPGAGRRLLLVDDDAITREIVTAMLAAHGFAVDAVETGAEAVERARQAVYDLVLLDINLPDMSGYDTADALRRAEAGKHHTRILAISASAAAADRARLAAAGIDGCLPKPLDDAALAAAVGLPPPPRGASPALQNPEALPLVDDFALRTLTAVVGAERTRQIQDQFWAEWPGHVTRLCELRLDMMRLAALAHRLTALAGNCGYLRLSLNCRDLMTAAAASPGAAVTDDLIGRVLDVGDATRAARAA